MYINDITPYKGIQLSYMRDIEPRRLELAEHMGILTKIPVNDGTELLHTFQDGDKFGLCYCADCVGDFSGASYDEWGGR